ncbi:MAG: serine acetyltransferase [Anaerocolumna sp.]
MSLKLGYQINVNTSIGEGLYLGHRGTIIVNGNAVLGSHINIANGVTIGQENRGIRKGAPIIGNKVWIGSNVTIVGHINIGNNVLIAPNTYVNFNIPDDSIVIGNPGKIIHSINATEGYI